jgi:hypothetical protein
MHLMSDARVAGITESGGALSQRRFDMLLVNIFAALGVGLADIGIYGVTSYQAASRTRELECVMPWAQLVGRCSGRYCCPACWWGS